MKQESLHFANNVVRQKLAYAGHILRGSSGSNLLLLLEGKFERKQFRRTWIDDLLQWTQ